jgi:hypothetical protein
MVGCAFIPAGNQGGGTLKDDRGEVVYLGWDIRNLYTSDDMGLWCEKFWLAYSYTWYCRDRGMEGAVRLFIWEVKMPHDHIQ